MNPLSTPWSKKSKEKPKPEKEKVPNFLGVRNEAVRDNADAACKVVIEVRGLTGIASGKYELAYEEGLKLGHYLSRVKLKRAATYAAVYDQTNLEKGRLRMTYIPQASSHIMIGPPGVGSAMSMQRTNHDAMKLAQNMGKSDRGSPAPSIVERKK